MLATTRTPLDEAKAAYEAAEKALAEHVNRDDGSLSSYRRWMELHAEWVRLGDLYDAQRGLW